MRKGRGEITPISSLFEKYRKTLQAPQGSVVTAFQEVVYDLFGIAVSKEKISYNTFSKTLSLRVPSTLKNEIVLKKKEIITHLKGRLGEKSAPKDIL